MVIVGLGKLTVGIVMEGGYSPDRDGDREGGYSPDWGIVMIVIGKGDIPRIF